MERILIIGSNGAGKSTFSYKLADLTKLPLVHVDQIYWCNKWEVTPREVVEKRLLEEAQKPKWIIEGNKLDLIEARLNYADTVFWFEMSPPRCIINILKRELKYRHQVRPDMPDECVSRINFKFLKLAFQFNKTRHEQIEKALKGAKHVNVIHFTNYRQVKQYFKEQKHIYNVL